MLNREEILSVKLERLNEIEGLNNLKCKLYAACGFGATGSIKDRVALYMIEAAEHAGTLKEGGTIIEATSGNTGIGIAYVAREKGYKAKIVMPANMTRERIDAMEKYGAEVLLSDASKGMAGASELAQEVRSNTPNSVILGQFDNPSNVRSHFDNTAPKIVAALGCAPDALVCGIGTGGTITGCAQYLMSSGATTYIVGAQPLSSPLLTKGFAGKHKIQGIGANFIPSILDRTLIDEIIDVSDDEAYAATATLYRAERKFVGISSGAALSAAVRLAKTRQYVDKTIVCIFPDKGDKYVSTGVFDE